MLIYLDISSVLLLLHYCLSSLHICFISNPDMHNISISPLLLFHSLQLSYILLLSSILQLSNNLQLSSILLHTLSLSLCFRNVLHMHITYFIQITSWFFAFYNEYEVNKHNSCLSPNHFLT